MPYDRSRPFPSTGVDRVAPLSGVMVLYRPGGEPVALFQDRWRLARVQEKLPDLFPTDS